MENNTISEDTNVTPLADADAVTDTPLDAILDDAVSNAQEDTSDKAQDATSENAQEELTQDEDIPAVQEPKQISKPTSNKAIVKPIAKPKAVDKDVETPKQADKNLYDKLTKAEQENQKLYEHVNATSKKMLLDNALSKLGITNKRLFKNSIDVYPTRADGFIDTDGVDEVIASIKNTHEYSTLQAHREEVENIQKGVRDDILSIIPKSKYKNLDKLTYKELLNCLVKDTQGATYKEVSSQTACEKQEDLLINAQIDRLKETFQT